MTGRQSTYPAGIVNKSAIHDSAKTYAGREAGVDEAHEYPPPPLADKLEHEDKRDHHDYAAADTCNCSAHQEDGERVCQGRCCLA